MPKSPRGRKPGSPNKSKPHLDALRELLAMPKAKTEEVLAEAVKVLTSRSLP